MPTYIGLIQYTQEGIEQFENHPDELAAAREAINDMGGELLEYYNTLGQYDAVAIAEFPNGEAAMMNSLVQARQGLVRVETLRAFDEDETERVIEQMTD
ncbi:MAG: GYD domain-containing protein [Halobacteriales archaeon]|nr:GYD domain-containing protein [Halobacteriales archaeon]